MGRSLHRFWFQRNQCLSSELPGKFEICCPLHLGCSLPEQPSGLWVSWIEQILCSQAQVQRLCEAPAQTRVQSVVARNRVALDGTHPIKAVVQFQAIPEFEVRVHLKLVPWTLVLG